MSGVWLKLINPESGLPRQNHRYRLRTFANTYSAHALVEWLVTNGHVRSRYVVVNNVLTFSIVWFQFLLQPDCNAHENCSIMFMSSPSVCGIIKLISLIS